MDTTRLWSHAASVLLLTSVGMLVPPVRTGETGTTAPEPAIVLVDLPAGYELLVEWAAGLFEDAGLTLPALRVTHHGDDREPCGGPAGVYRHRDGVRSIELCTLQGGVFAERLVLHELAHAWAASGLSDVRKQEFQALRGWTWWAGGDGASWDELGSEQAAEIIAWGLSDRPVPSVLVDRSTCADFELGYRALTGEPPLHGLHDRC